MNDKRIKYPVYGLWKVTTEGDVEARTTRELGTFRGFIDDIAFHLADQQYYKLQFHYLSEDYPKYIPKNTEVIISLDIDSGTWDMKPDERVNFMENLFKNRNVVVLPAASYAAVTLSKNKGAKEKLLKQQALDKLTDKEKEILGLN